MRAGDRAHEQDDRRHGQAGRNDGGREADLPLGVQDPTAGGGQQQHERAEDLREQPPVGEPGIFEVGPRAELECQQMQCPRPVVIGQARRR